MQLHFIVALFAATVKLSSASPVPEPAEAAAIEAREQTHTLQRRTYGLSCNGCGHGQPKGVAWHIMVCDSCRRPDGSWSGRTELNLDNCIANHFGRLVWSRGGNFSRTCREDLSLIRDPHVVKAMCGNGAGVVEWPRINLGENVHNRNGALGCF